jgi:hypothetical protein
MRSIRRCGWPVNGTAGGGRIASTSAEAKAYFADADGKGLCGAYFVTVKVEDDRERKGRFTGKQREAERRAGRRRIP